LSSFQVFDDLKDIWVDFGKQPNYPLQIAATRYPEEYAALQTAMPSSKRVLDQNEPPWLATRVPQTVLTCLRLARLMALAHFDWFTFYVADYRWRRNWLLRVRSFHRPTVEREAGSTGRPPFSTGVSILDSIFATLSETRALRRELLQDP